MSGEQGWFAYAPVGGASFSTLSREVGAVATGGPDPHRRPEFADVARLARRGLKGVLAVARADERPTPGRLIRDFLGEEAAGSEVVEQTWAGYEGVNLQTALDSWLTGLTGLSEREYTLHGIQSLNSDATLALMLAPDCAPYTAQLANVSRASLACGPDGQTMPCVRSGLYLVDDPAGRVVLFARLAAPQYGQPQTVLEVLSGDIALARTTATQIKRLSRELNVFRRQVLSFNSTMFTDSSVLTFHRRPTMTRDDLVLDDDVLAAIERQVVGVARHREALLASGQHLKRGLLLYGPPGVGKTHTVRYLISTLPDVTVIEVSGGALEYIGTACSAARELAPAIVVVEDVDLIAEDRGMHPGEHPLLFSLLNEMDGIEGDADVAFVLTTNRADLLEPALAARPGRVDEAVEIELPDTDARRRLFDLYRGRLHLDADEERITAALTRAEGVTASFLKELLRRAALVAAERADRSAVPPARASDEPPHGQALTVTADDLDAALDGLLAVRSRMTRALLGSEPVPTGDDLSRAESTAEFGGEFFDEGP